MKYADINKKYTATVAEYLANGYTINTRTMSGSQGDYAHIDLTDGTEVIPNCENDYRPLWNTKLDIISRERFYEIGADYRHGKFYGTLEEATAAHKLKYQRYAAKHQVSKTKDITAKAMEIAKRIIRREFNVKRICEADVTVSKSNGTYTIKYKSKVYRLH